MDKSESKHFKYFAGKKVDSELINGIVMDQENNIAHIAQIMHKKSLDTLPEINIWIFKNDEEKYL